MGFLDMFDSPDILGKILGVGEAQAAPGRSPPPQVMAQAPPPPVNPGIADQPRQSQAIQEVGPMPDMLNNPGPAAPVQQIPQITVNPAQRQAPPLPPPVQVGPGPGQPAPAQPTYAPYDPTSGGAAPPQTVNTGGGLLSALGIDPNRARVIRGSLGNGMSAIAHLPAGAPKGQAIAAGLGGGLQGNEAARTQQDQQERQNRNDLFAQSATKFQQGRQTNNDLFNQSSTAFKDMLAAKQSDNMEEYRKAQAAYLAARANSVATMTKMGKTGSNAWQTTPYGQVAVAEQRVTAYDTPRRKSIDAQVRQNALDPEKAKELYDKLDRETNSYRDRLYQSMGIDPKKAQKLKDAGTSADNPFDTKGMSLDQFHEQVPMGGWFKDQNGVVRQRTVAPPGANAQPQGPGANAAPNTDDYSAMQLAS